MVIKISKKNFKSAIIALVLLVALLITSIFAFLSASDTKTNVVTLGDIGIKLMEDGWEQVSEVGNENFGLYVRTDGTSFDTIPGDIIDKAPYIINTGVNDVWAYLIVKVPAVTSTEFSNSAAYLSTYGPKYDIKVTALGVQNGLFRDEDGNNISNSEDIWNSYFGENNAFIDEAPASSTRKEFIDINGIDDENWTKLMTFKGEKHNFHVYGYNNVVRGSKYLERELATLNAETDQERIDEINAMLTNNEYDQTTSLFQSFKLNNYFGSGYGSSLSAKPLGGCLFYIDEREFTYTDQNGTQRTIHAGEDEDGHPYRYTFYDENGVELTDAEIFTGNHKIVNYTVDVPQYYEDALLNEEITLAEYNAVPKAPIFDKYYVVAAQDNTTKTAYSLIYGNNDVSAAVTAKQVASWSSSNDTASVATYTLNIYVKNFLKENNIIDKYYVVNGDTWTLNSNAVDSNTLIGMGKYNTKFIYEFYGTNNNNYFGTQSIWSQLNLFNNDNSGSGRNKTGCYDWYIPSKDEITAIRNVYASTTSKFSVNNVWTSSEISNVKVWYAKNNDFSNTRMHNYSTYDNTFQDNKQSTHTSQYGDRNDTGTIFVRSF